MVIQYSAALDLKKLIEDIVKILGMTHIDLKRVIVLRSRGSNARRTLARIHGLPRIWQKSLDVKPHYVIEVISEQFDKLDIDERKKTLIHELLHIPSGFGGGFRHHGTWVDRRRVEHMFRIYDRNRRGR